MWSSPDARLPVRGSCRGIMPRPERTSTSPPCHLLFPPSQRRVVAMNIKRLKDIGCYRGRRHIMVSRTAASASVSHDVDMRQPTCAAGTYQAECLARTWYCRTRNSCGNRASSEFYNTRCMASTLLGKCLLYMLADGTGSRAERVGLVRSKEVTSHAGFFFKARGSMTHLLYPYPPCLQGLPCRGQKTKCNARTRKGKAKTVANKVRRGPHAAHVLLHDRGSGCTSSKSKELCPGMLVISCPLHY